MMPAAPSVPGVASNSGGRFGYAEPFSNSRCFGLGCAPGRTLDIWDYFDRKHHAETRNRCVSCALLEEVVTTNGTAVRADRLPVPPQILKEEVGVSLGAELVCEGRDA